MTIDRTKLVDLLIEKTNLSPKEVEVQLDQLIERILDAAERGKALEIKEFGLFFFDQEGNLKFEPSEELSTEISFKYAGMKPVELKPERNTAIPEDDELSGPINSTEDLIVLPKSDQKSQPAKPKAAPEPKKDAKPKPPSKTILRQPNRKKRNRSAVWALLAFFSVLFIGALIYFNGLLDPVSENSTAVTESPQQEAGTTDSLEIAANNDTEIEGNVTSVEIIDDDAINDEPSEEQIAEATVPTEDQMYGLTGEVVEEINNEYSIVIHSLYNDLRAEEVAEDYRAQGYRVHVTARVVDGLEAYRVSLGQFESITAAQEAALTLPEPLNENNFIQRIQ